MSLENIYFQDYENLNFDGISDDALKKIVLDFLDPFIATSALSERSIRQSTGLSDLADDILNKSIGDKYLQAIAFKTLYEFDKDRAVSYIKDNVLTCDIKILSAIMESIVIDEGYFQKDNNLKEISKKGFERFKGIAREEFNYPDEHDWVIAKFSL